MRFTVWTSRPRPSAPGGGEPGSHASFSSWRRPACMARAITLRGPSLGFILNGGGPRFSAWPDTATATGDSFKFCAFSNQGEIFSAEAGRGDGVIPEFQDVSPARFPCFNEPASKPRALARGFFSARGCARSIFPNRMWPAPAVAFAKAASVCNPSGIPTGDTGQTDRGSPTYPRRCGYVKIPSSASSRKRRS